MSLLVQVQPPQFKSPERPPHPPSATTFLSPGKAEMARSQEILHRVLHPRVMKQERPHSLSKRPHLRCAVEADLKIQEVLSATQQVAKRAFGNGHKNEGSLESTHHTLEEQVDQLSLEYQRMARATSVISNTSFEPTTSDDPRQQQSTTVTPQKPPTVSSSVFLSPASPPDSPSSYHSKSTLLDLSRKKNLLDMTLTRLHAKVKIETKTLQNIFQSNFTVLKFRRAEACVLSLIKLQRRLKTLEQGVCQARDRLAMVCQ